MPRALLIALILVLAQASSLYAAAAPLAVAPAFDDNGTPLSIAQFVEKYIPADMPEGLGRKEVQAALEDAGANWVELAKLITMEYRLRDDQEQGSSFASGLWLIVNAPHLDRLELNADFIVSTLIVGVMNLEDHGYDPTSELYRRYVLNYRFDDEPVSPWVRDFMVDFVPEADVPRPSLAEMNLIMQMATQDFTVIDRGYLGNLSDPLSLLQSRAGSKRELSILVAAALRSQGYATRFVRENRSGESWVEVYNGDPRNYDASAWTPVYPTAPKRTGDTSYAVELCGGRIAVVTAGDAFGREQVTSRYSAGGRVTPAFTRTSPLGEVEQDKDFSGWAITAWNEKSGDFAPLDDLEYPSSDKDYPLSAGADGPPEGTYALGPGKYRLECGTRYPGGISHVQVREFSIAAGQSVTVAMDLAAPADLPAAALVERQLGEFTDSPRLLHQGRYVFLVGDGGEPSLRALELLKPLESRNSVHYQHWRMVGATDEDRAFVHDVLKVEDADATPVVIVVVDGATRLYLRGYNLNVAQWVDHALEGE